MHAQHNSKKNYGKYFTFFFYSSDFPSTSFFVIESKMEDMHIKLTPIGEDEIWKIAIDNARKIISGLGDCLPFPSSDEQKHIHHAFQSSPSPVYTKGKESTQDIITQLLQQTQPSSSWYVCMFCAFRIHPTQVSAHLDLHASQNMFKQKHDREQKKVFRWNGALMTPFNQRDLYWNQKEEKLDIVQSHVKDSTAHNNGPVKVWTLGKQARLSLKSFLQRLFKSVKLDCTQCVDCVLCKESVHAPVWNDEEERFEFQFTLNLRAHSSDVFSFSSNEEKWDMIWNMHCCATKGKNACSCFEQVRDWLLTSVQKLPVDVPCPQKSCMLICFDCFWMSCETTFQKNHSLLTM